MTIVYVGADIAKASFEAALWQPDTPVQLGEFSNNPHGYRQLAKALSRYTKGDAVVQLVAEPTGTYHLGLVGYAHAQAWQVSLPNPKMVRQWTQGQGQRTGCTRTIFFICFIDFYRICT